MRYRGAEPEQSSEPHESPSPTWRRVQRGLGFVPILVLIVVVALASSRSFLGASQQERVAPDEHLDALPVRPFLDGVRGATALVAVFADPLAEQVFSRVAKAGTKVAALNPTDLPRKERMSADGVLFPLLVAVVEDPAVRVLRRYAECLSDRSDPCNRFTQDGQLKFAKQFEQNAQLRALGYGTDETAGTEALVAQLRSEVNNFE